MKNKKTFLIYIIPIIFISILVIIFTILGSVNRIGYLTNIKYIENNIYSFRISYYDEVFRNSDIYGVYIDIEKTINYNNFIKNIKIEEKGSPFGTLITTKEIDIDKIDNIEYTLKIKKNVYLYAFIIYLFFIFLFYIFSTIKENKLILAYIYILIIMQIFIYLLLYNYFRIVS